MCRKLYKRDLQFNKLVFFYCRIDNGERKIKEIFSDISAEVSGLESHHVVGMFVILFVVVSILIYFGLISYRNKLEYELWSWTYHRTILNIYFYSRKKYGMRELLVTEEDFYVNNDTRHIEVSCWNFSSSHPSFYSIQYLSFSFRVPLNSKWTDDDHVSNTTKY